MPSFITDLISRKNTAGTATETENDNKEDESWIILPDLSPVPLKETAELQRKKNDEKIMQHFGISLKPRGHEVE